MYLMQVLCFLHNHSCPDVRNITSGENVCFRLLHRIEKSVKTRHPSKLRPGSVTQRDFFFFWTKPKTDVQTRHCVMFLWLRPATFDSPLMKSICLWFWIHPPPNHHHPTVNIRSSFFFSLLLLLHQASSRRSWSVTVGLLSQGLIINMLEIWLDLCVPPPKDICHRLGACL